MQVYAIENMYIPERIIGDSKSILSKLQINNFFIVRCMIKVSSLALLGVSDSESSCNLVEPFASFPSAGFEALQSTHRYQKGILFIECSS